MIKEFYSNPETFSPEVEEAFKFPDQKSMKAWKVARDQPTDGTLRAVVSRPHLIMTALGIGVSMVCVMKAMGPHGDAMKIIKNKSMSPLRYYGLRIAPLLICGFVLNSLRSEVDYSNPYSRGQLK